MGKLYLLVTVLLRISQRGPWEPPKWVGVISDIMCQLEFQPFPGDFWLRQNPCILLCAGGNIFDSKVSQIWLRNLPTFCCAWALCEQQTQKSEKTMTRLTACSKPRSSLYMGIPAVLRQIKTIFVNQESGEPTIYAQRTGQPKAVLYPERYVSRFLTITVLPELEEQFLATTTTTTTTTKFRIFARSFINLMGRGTSVEI